MLIKYLENLDEAMFIITEKTCSQLMRKNSQILFFVQLFLTTTSRLPAWHIQRLHDIDANRLKHALTAFGAGFLFSLAIAPCAAPILLGILTLVAMQGDLVWGGLLMFIYGLGTGLPLLLIGHGYERLQPWLATPRRQRGLRTISGLLLLGVGVYILWAT